MGGLWGLLVAQFVFVSVNGLIVANGAAGGLASVRERTGAASAVLGALQYGGGMIGSALVGSLANAAPVPMGAIMALAGLGAVLSTLWVTKARRPSERTCSLPPDLRISGGFGIDRYVYPVYIPAIRPWTSEIAMLNNKIALVTGSATGGIGLATCRALAAHKCNIILHGLGERAAIETTREALAKEFGVKVAYSDADLTSVEQIEALVAMIDREFGGIDILVNNAVARNRATIEGLTKERWDIAVAVNLSAPFHLIRLALPHMKKANWGRIINIASNLGLQGTNMRSDYVATKHAIVGLTRAVALEVLDYGITCNSIAPGSTKTQQAEWQIAEIMKQTKTNREEATKLFLSNKQPSRRIVLPEHIAELILFLCGDAASEMTGSPIAIDGGWVAGSVIDWTTPTR